MLRIAQNLAPSGPFPQIPAIKALLLVKLEKDWTNSPLKTREWGFISGHAPSSPMVIHAPEQIQDIPEKKTVQSQLIHHRTVPSIFNFVPQWVSCMKQPPPFVVGKRREMCHRALLLTLAHYKLCNIMPP